MTIRFAATLAACLAASGAQAQFVRVWGSNSYGQCVLPPDLGTATDVSHGDNHLLAITSTGQVRAWGRRGSGQTNVPPGLGTAVAVAAGGLHSLAMLADGSLAAWGSNAYGQATVPAAIGP